MGGWKTWAVFTALLLVIEFFFLYTHFQAKLEAYKPEVVQSTTESIDTLKNAPKEPKTIRIVDYVEIPFEDSTSIKALEEKNSILLNDIASLERRNDSLLLVLAKEQKVYEDSTYKAWVSGVSPSLDSIYVFQKTIVQKEIALQKYKAKWNFGLQVGGGIVLPYNETPKAGCYCGVGVTYNF